MSNPTAQVPTESIPFGEDKVYWPLDPTNTSDVIYNGEMMGMRFDTGYAYHFDDSTPMLFLGTKEGILHRLQSDTPTTDFKELVRRPRYVTLPLASGTAAIPANVGSPAYAADSGHVQLTTSGLTNNNLAGMVVDIGRSGSTGGGTGGILSLSTTSTPASVVVVPPTFGCLVGLVVSGLAAAGTNTSAPAMTITGGVGNGTGAGANITYVAGKGGATGAGGAVTVTAGAAGGGNANGGAVSYTGGLAAGTGTGGAVTLTGGASAGATGTAGGVTIDAGAPAAGTKANISIGTANAAFTVIGAQASVPAAAQTIATGNTITLPATTSSKLLTTGGAATGVILTAGTQDGQQLTLINNSGNSITFAASGTSNVADGTGAVIAANKAMYLEWSATASLWFHS